MCDTKKIEIVHKIYCAVFNVNAQLRNEDLSLSNLGIPTDKHVKKCVFGVFLNHTLIALVRKN